ncbi:multicopper oxidase family protein [Propylenella binzhouense]|uniref:multicopper oxidase family protein n=1 Tax=Propylenella binzhouense TaxID=2555902 RepID=UPI001FE78217|nr:multicopper oxidase domain-containing protein [Propylenella binzhouense]
MAGTNAFLPGAVRSAFAGAATPLRIERRTLDVRGRAASVFGITKPGGSHGIALDPGEGFTVDLHNATAEDTIVHWHGQTPEWSKDGVVIGPHAALRPNEVRRYDYEPRPGTHWMHSHLGLQEQLLLAAPLIVRTPEDLRADVQEVVILLHDFTFRDPTELLADLRGSAMAHATENVSSMGHGGMAGMDHMTGDEPDVPLSGLTVAPDAHAGGPGQPDLNDVEYDAYLANDRTLDDPEVVTVERGGRVRLRIINGATTSAFQIDLGTLQGTVIAADGNPVRPVKGKRFGMTMGQRLDVVLSLPREGGAWPILAQREGDRERTGIILATQGSPIARVAGEAGSAAPPVDLSLEESLFAVDPLPHRHADVTFRTALTGTMMGYVWSIDDRTWGNHTPIEVHPGQRVAIEMRNVSPMAHPMHLHGHHFQVIGINGRPLKGAVRDTVLVPVNGAVTIAFDTDNPGRWPFHCHNLLHMAAGMITEVAYETAPGRS